MTQTVEIECQPHNWIPHIVFPALGFSLPTGNVKHIQTNNKIAVGILILNIHTG